MWTVYILKCSDDSYYVGHTNNLKERIHRHNSARAAKWTSCRLPIRFVYKELHQTEKQAILREKQIKKWSRAKKEALINGDIKALQRMSKRKWWLEKASHSRDISDFILDGHSQKSTFKCKKRTDNISDSPPIVFVRRKGERRLPRHSCFCEAGLFV